MRKLKIGIVLMAVVLIFSLAVMGEGIVDSSLRLSLPSPLHPFGCDSLGRDLMARIARGVVVSITLCFFSSVVAVSLSLLSVLFLEKKGLAYSLFLSFVTSFKSIPTILVALLLSSLFGGTPLSVGIALSISGFASSSRVLIAKATEIRGEEYMISLDALGLRKRRIRMHHLLPSLMPYAREEWASLFMSFILAESSLSFLGVGINPSIPTLGRLLSEGKAYMLTKPHMIIFPSIFLLLVGSAVMLISRGLSELDPASH